MLLPTQSFDCQPQAIRNKRLRFAFVKRINLQPGRNEVYAINRKSIEIVCLVFARVASRLAEDDDIRNPLQYTRAAVFQHTSAHKDPFSSILQANLSNYPPINNRGFSLDIQVLYEQKSQFMVKNVLLF